MGFWEWAIFIFLALGSVAFLFEKASEGIDLEWADVWYFTKNILILCLTWLFMPIILIYNLYEDGKWEKSQKDKAAK